MGNGSAATLENSGTLTISQGGNTGGSTYVDGSGMATVNLVSNGWTVQYTASSLKFNTATVMFRGTNLGTTAISPTGSNASATTVAFGTAPTLTGGAYAANHGTPTVGIIQFATGDSVIGGVDTYGLVTYDNTATTGVGVRLLTSSEYLTPGSQVGGNVGNSIPITNATNSNMLLDQTANNNSAAFTMTTGTATVNSLTLANATTFTQSGGSFTNNSAMYVANGGSNVLTLSSGYGNTPIFEVLGSNTTLTSNTPFTGNGFLYISGNGTFIMNAAENQNGGALIIAGGTFRVGIDNLMTGFTNPGGITVAGTLDLNGHNLVTPIMTGNTFGGAGIITNSTSTPVTLTFQGETPGNNNNFNNAPFVGNINDGAVAGGMTVTKTGPTAMFLAGGGTYSGGLNVLNGPLVLGSDTAQGASTINLGDTSGSNNAALLFGSPGLFGMPGLFKPSTININIRSGSSGIATFGLDLGIVSNVSSAATSVTFDGSVAVGKNAYITGAFDERVSGAPLTAATLSNTGGTQDRSTLIIGASATFSGPGSLTQNGGIIQWTSPSTSGFTIPGGYGVLFGISQFILSNQPTGGTYTFATTNGTTPVNVVLNGSSLPTAQGSNIATFVTIVAGTGTYTVNTPFTIGVNGASLLTNNNNISNTNGATANIIYSGAITLGGMLAINGTGAQNGGTGFGNATPPNLISNQYAGNITLNATGALLGIRYQAGNGGTADSGGNGDVSQNSILTSVIMDGTGSAGTPLDLQASIFTGNQYEPFNVTGASTYAGGTLIRSAANIINVTASGATVGTPGIVTTSNASLGTGNLYIEAGGNVRLNSSASVNTAGGATITVAGDALNTSVLSLGYVPISQAGLNITSTSSGTLGIDTGATNFTLALTMGNLGNGTMFLGSFSTGTYSASSLGVGTNAPTPGTGVSTPTYRLGTGGGQNSNNVLTISGANVITGSANLIVNLPGARDTSNNILGAPIGNFGGQGTVKFTNASGALDPSFTGTITINGGFQEGSVGTLETAVSTTAGVEPLRTNSIYLVGGNLQLDTPTSGSGRTDLTIGDLNVGGGTTQLSTNAATNNGTVNKLTIGSATGIVRPANGGVLLISGGGLGSTTQGAQIFALNASNANSANGSLGMVTIGGITNPAPWILTGGQDGGDFMAYTAQGLVTTTYTLAGSVGNVNDATGGTFLNQAVSTDIVRIQNTAGGADSSMTASQAIYALRIALGNNRSPTITSTTASTGVTLSITSGGLTSDGQGNTTTFGSTTAANAVNVYFGNGTAGTVSGLAPGATVEGVIWANTNINFINVVTAASLSITGGFQETTVVTLTNTANLIAGNIVINSGNVTAVADGSLGTAGGSLNNVVLNGGTLTIPTSVTHNIEVGAPGGGLVFSGGGTFSGNISNLSGLTTGIPVGPLSISVGGNAVIFSNTTSNWSGGTNITSTGTGSLTVAPNATFGTGDVNLFISANRNAFYNTTVTLQGTNNLGANAGVNTDFGSTLNLTNTSGPVVIGSLEGSGNVMLGVSAGAGTTATFGSNNRSTEFDGIISQVSTSASGIIKAGSGTMTLAGASTYAGPTVVSGGTLRITGSLAGTGAVTVGGAGATGSLPTNGPPTTGPALSGTGRVAGAVTINGPGGGVAGTIYASNFTGITPLTTVAPLTLTGGLTLNAGSFSSFTLNSSSPNNTSNPLIAVSGGSGLIIAGASTVNLSFSNNAALAVGQTYDLFGYSSITGFGNLSVNTAGLPGSFGYSLVNNTGASQVDLTILATLAWTGVPGGGGSLNNTGTAGQWDTSSFNWASGSGAAAQFNTGAGVEFADTYTVTGGNTNGTPSSSVVVQAGGVQPSTVTFANHAVSYTLSDADGNSGLGISDSTGGPTPVTLSGNSNGGATVTFTNPNSYSGATTITGGSTLVFSNSNQLGNGSGTNSLVLNNGTLKYAASSTNTDISGRPVTIAAGGATIDVNDNSVSYANAIGNSGTGGLTVASTTAGGTLTLLGTSAYSGTTTINSGATLQLGNGTTNGALAGGGVTVNTNGTLSINSAGQTFSNNISGGGSLVTQGGSGFMTIVSLSGTNSYSGGTTIQSGTLRVTSNSNVTNGSLPLNTALALGGSSGGQLDLNGHNIQVSALNSTNSSSNIETTTGTLATLTFAGTGSPSTYAGLIQDSGTPGPAPEIALAVTGGSLTLINNGNTYSGGTTVTGGTLAVNAPISFAFGATGAGTVTVGDGTHAGSGTLTGTGFIGGTSSPTTVTIQNGGTIAGTSGNTLTVTNSLTLTSGSTVLATLNHSFAGSSSNPLITVAPGLFGNGTLNVSGTPAVTIGGSSSLVSGDVYNVLSYSTNALITTSSFSLPSSFSGFTLTWSTPSNDELQVSVSGSGGGSNSPMNAVDYWSASPPAHNLQFGTANNWSVQTNNGYVNIQSTIQSGIAQASGSPGGGGPFLTTDGTSGANPLYASILAGTNSGTFTGGGSAAATMSWRARAKQETDPQDGGTPSSPPLQYVGSYLISNVLQLQGLGTSGSSANYNNATNMAYFGSNTVVEHETDPFVLQMNYNVPLLSGEAGQAKKGTIYLGWLAPAGTSSNGNLNLAAPTWQKANTGDFNGSGQQTGTAANGTDALANFQGSFAAFLSAENTAHPGLFSDDPSLNPANLSNADLAAILGSYGVDTTGHDVWAVINHNSQFAVVPEPSTLLLAALGLLGVAGYQVRRRRK